MRLAHAAALLCLGLPLPGAAQPGGVVTHVQTVAELAAVCAPAWDGVPRLEAIAYCQGFLTSAGQYHTLLHPAGGRIRPLYCVPSPGPSIAESGVDFAAWAAANPTHRAEPALDGLLRWAESRFPCPAVAAPPRQTRAAR